jgi:prepilin-type N-terminal cleavage/methylation domain-containing protein
MRTSRSAFTLVEMLIAVVLLSLLIGTALFAFRYQLLTFTKMEPAALDRALAYHRMRSSIQSMHYYVVDSYDRFGRAQQDLHYYFSGTPERMRYITQSPLFSDAISVAELACTEEGLRYSEEALYAGNDYLRPDRYELPESLLLFDGLSSCRIRYITERGDTEGLEREIPRAVRIDLEEEGRTRSLYTVVRADNNVTLARIRDMQNDQ